MKYTFLGKTGMKVSRLCLGTMNFARHTSEQDYIDHDKDP